MTDPTEPSAPLPAHECPLCGGGNACAVAQSGSFDTPCWCREVTVAPDLLARIPEERRGQSCVCQDCVTRDRDAAI